MNMGPVTRRLNALWLQQTHLTLTAPERPYQLATQMIVKVNEPLRIGRSALPPGTYVLRLSDAGENCHSAQILNEDQTELIATINTPLEHASL
jgi:hypothetical protein